MCVRTIKKILVVDDEPDIREVLLSALRAKGYEVSAARGGDAAIDLISDANAHDEPFDVVILDWAMPDMGGLETAIKIREMHARAHDELPVRVEVLTGHSDLGIMPDSIKERIAVAKTWAKTDIVEMVASL